MKIAGSQVRIRTFEAAAIALGGNADVLADTALDAAEDTEVLAIDLDGQPVDIEVDGWRARILQHEFDHLDGVLYLDRLGDRDWRTAQKISRKQGWGTPGKSWMPGVDDLDA